MPGQHLAVSHIVVVLSHEWEYCTRFWPFYFGAEVIPNGSLLKQNLLKAVMNVVKSTDSPFEFEFEIILPR